MKKTLLTLAILSTAAHADEGMWMPQQLPQVAKQLKAAGLKLDPAALTKLTEFPMGAIVSLGGCSASFVSPQGLVATNHHCVYNSVAVNSTPERDLLANGFLARTLAEELPAAPGMFAAGGVIGVVSGLLGAGGGFISIPFMSWCNIKIHNAVATSAALGFPIALAGTLSNIYFGWGEPGLPPYSLGFIYLPALLTIAAASVTMAPLGARVAHKMPVRKLQRIFALILYALAGYMLWKAFK